MPTASFGKWCAYMQNAWNKVVVTSQEGSYNYNDHAAGAGWWVAIAINIPKQADYSSYDTLTVKIPIYKFGATSCEPKAYLMSNGWGGSGSPNGTQYAYQDLGSVGVPTTLEVSLSCSSLSTTIDNTVYLWLGGGSKYFYINKNNGSWSISLTGTESKINFIYKQNASPYYTKTFSGKKGAAHYVKGQIFSRTDYASKERTINLNGNGGNNSSKTQTNLYTYHIKNWLCTDLLNNGESTKTYFNPGDEVRSNKGATFNAMWEADTLHEYGSVLLGSTTRDRVNGQIAYNVTLIWNCDEGNWKDNSYKSFTYDCIGWATSKNNANNKIIKYSTDQYYSVSEAELWAVWEESVIFSDYILPDCPPEIQKPGYVFKGWKKEGKIYQPGLVPLTSDAIFEAIWEPQGSVYIKIPGQDLSLTQPYIFFGGQWQQIVPYVYTSSEWKITE